MTKYLTEDIDLGSGRNKTLCHLSDIHDTDITPVIVQLREIRPDIICISGDLCFRHLYPGPRNGMVSAPPAHALTVLGQLREIAPVFLSRGNHERGWDALDIAVLSGKNVRFVENNWAEYGDILIGGLPSSKAGPDLKWLDAFERAEGYRILLCHHPEYYRKYLKNRKLDLILSGHAHGGQIRLGRQGLYAPGQGILPGYTSGLYDGRLVVSRGLSNARIRIPRLNNPYQTLIIHL